MLQSYHGSTIPSSLEPIMPCSICRLMQKDFNVSQFDLQETFFPVSVLFPRCKLCLHYTAGNLTKIQACEQLQKFCDHKQVGTFLIFASNLSKGQILRALSNWMGLFDTPRNIYACHYKKCCNPKITRQSLREIK